MINRENYEIVFIDYLDGNLTPEAAAELQLFLEKNPDLKDELNAVGGVELVAEEVRFDQKSQLKHSQFEDADVFNKACIASLENELNRTEEQELKDFIAADAARQNNWYLFQQTKFKPDPSIIFENKETLYRKVIAWWYHPQIAAIAAAIVVALLIISTFDRQNPFNSNYTARNLSYHIHAPHPQIKTEQATNDLRSSIPADKAENQIEILPKTPIRKEDPVLPHQEPERQNAAPVFAKLNGKKGSLPTHIYIYKPQLALNNVRFSAKSELRPMEKVNLVGKSLLTDERGKLKNIPKKDIQSGLLASVKRLTNDIINFETDKDGKIKTLNLNGELLALSIPLSGN